uniref:Uncharacterized protein n=1 Tax=Anser brachyrhynchus TaxID=132585 RepID=A0A8B9BNA6_9AVES
MLSGFKIIEWLGLEGTLKMRRSSPLERTQCENCTTVDAERQGAGRVGTHGKVCRLPVPVRASLPWLVPEEERTRGAGQPVKRQVCTRKKEHRPKVLPAKFNYVSASYVLCVVLGGHAVGSSAS